MVMRLFLGSGAGFDGGLDGAAARRWGWVGADEVAMEDGMGWEFCRVAVVVASVAAVAVVVVVEGVCDGVGSGFRARRADAAPVSRVWGC